MAESGAAGGLRVVGAGLGRTGTHSLKLALETLLGGRCYHMIEVFGRPDDIDVWRRAAEGDMPGWTTFFSEFRATVDWPGCSFWREIAGAFPDAVVVLSRREDAAAWWRSASGTIFEVAARPTDDPLFSKQLEMISAVLANRFTPDWRDEQAAIAAYERHNAEVLGAVEPSRLLEWRPEDGWGPLCTALGTPVPDEPFPHVNTTADFRSMAGLDG